MTDVAGIEGTEPTTTPTADGASPAPSAHSDDECDTCGDPWGTGPRFAVLAKGVVYDHLQSVELSTADAQAFILNEQQRQAEQLAHVEAMMLQAAAGLVEFGNMFEQLTANGGGLLGKVLGLKMPKE